MAAIGSEAQLVAKHLPPDVSMGRTKLEECLTGRHFRTKTEVILCGLSY